MREKASSIVAIYNRTLSDQPWIPPGVELMAAENIWPTTRGQGTIVAVLDTGIDYRHPDLAGNVIGGRSFIPDEPDYLDLNGHGTHVAGIIAANGKILGMAPYSKLLAVKVLNQNGFGSFISIKQGLAWVRNWVGENGERVNAVNMSLGSSVPNNAMHQEIINLVNSGITVICAAGNSGDGNPDTPEKDYPAYYPETIAVGAIDLQTGIANFSNSNDRIDVVAPGVSTYSTYLDNTYVELSGTSMASPHIAGAVALIISCYQKRFNENPTPEYIRDYLHTHAVDLGELGFDTLYGYGLFTFNTDGGKTIRVFLSRNGFGINSDLTPS